MFNLSKVCKDMGISIFDINENKEFLEKIGINVSKGGAYAIEIKGKPYIFFDKTESVWTNKLMVAHELGHILAGHLQNDNLSVEAQEAEARAFAGSLLALTVLLHYKESEIV